MHSEETIEEANRKLTRAVIDLPGVSAVGIGECDGEPCLLVFVEVLSPALRDTIPSSMDGYSVQIEESGPIRALDETD